MKVVHAISEQERTAGCTLYLLQQGIFYHAFGRCAAFMRAVTGYRVRTVRLGKGFTDQLGIPCAAIDCALHKVEKKYPDVTVCRTPGTPHYTLTLPSHVAAEILYEATTT